MKIDFIFLSREEPYTSPKGGTYYSFNGLLLDGTEKTLVVAETDKSGYDSLSDCKIAQKYAGNFTLKASFGRKRPEVRLVSVLGA